jgi:hypothetical protein
MRLTEEKLIQWQDSKLALDLAKETEAELRANICVEILQDKVKGTAHLEIASFKVTATGVVNNKIDLSIFSTILKELSAEEKSCIRYKPELIASAYKQLPDDSTLHKAVVTSSGKSTLKIKIIED